MDVAVHASSTVTPTYTWTREGTTLKPANAGDTFQIGNDPDAKMYWQVGTGANSRLWMQDGDSTLGNYDAQAVWWSGNAYIDEGKSWALSYDGTTTTGPWDVASNDGHGIRLARGIQNGEMNFGIIQLQQSTSSNPVASAIQVYRGTSIVWDVDYQGVAGFSNITLNLEPDNSANYNSSGEYNGPTLDVKDKLQKAVTALTTIKTAASDSYTDLAGLKAAIVSALADF